MKRFIILGVAMLAGLALPSTAQANPNISSDSTCGLHAGKVLRRDSGGTIYLMRMGPRQYHSGGSMACKGHVRKPSAKTTTDGCCSINWKPFSLPNWRDFFNARIANTDVTTAFTTRSCMVFGAELAAVLVSEGAATPALAIGGAGCAWGVHKLGPKIPSGTVNLRGAPITAPRR